MMDMIVDKFNEIIFNACGRYAERYGVQTENVQVNFWLKDDEVNYSILNQYKPVEQVTFKQILNVKIDMRGYSIMVPRFIAETLNMYAEEMECNVEELLVMCVVPKKETKGVVLWLYRGHDPVKEINLKELLK